MISDFIGLLLFHVMSIAGIHSVHRLLGQIIFDKPCGRQEQLGVNTEWIKFDYMDQRSAISGDTRGK